MIIPKDFITKMELDMHWHATVLSTIDSCSAILSEDPFFFPEYTDHKIQHIENVLYISSKFIKETTFRKFTCEDISILILVVLSHDLGMHLSFEGFKNLLLNDYYNNCNKYFNDDKWSEIWSDYLITIKLWPEKKKLQIFGEDVDIFDIPKSLNDITYKHRLLIGEFIRINHHRLAQDIIINGFPLAEDNKAFISTDIIDEHKTTIALLARSHGEDLWNMIKIIQESYYYNSDSIFNVHIYYLMTLLRLADFFDISEKRANISIFHKHTFQSPVSNLEWKINQSIKAIDFGTNTDKEKIFIWVSGVNESIVYLKINELLLNMQKELDQCWAVLGYINSDYKLCFRRVTSNITDVNSNKSNLNFITDYIFFKVHNHLLKMLIYPLYGDNIYYGVRVFIAKLKSIMLQT